jgi:predicted NUDIX family NTP pyrophosphohydrolase
MPLHSAGILVFRRRSPGIEVFLAHPGGPFWARKDEHAWSIPKGLYEPDEDPLDAAKREFEEETGMTIDGRFIPLGEFKQPAGKLIKAYAIEADVDEARITSNSFEMEWPPKSGRRQSFPEIDRAQWFDLGTAARKMHKGQIPILQALAKELGIVDPN